MYLLVFTAVYCGVLQNKNLKEMIFWVNSTKVPCAGTASTHCLEVQKGEVLDAEKWELFYNEIEGFAFNPGNIYKLKVKVEELDPKDIVADASTVKYTLIKILSKKQDVTLRLHDIWVVTLLNGKELTFNDEENRPRLELQISEKKIYGKGTCNTFFGTIKKVSATQLEISYKIGSTLMACPKMEIEATFFATLPKVKTYKIANNNLMLFDTKNKEIIRLKKTD